MFRSLFLKILTVAFLFSLGMPLSADAQVYLFPVVTDAETHYGPTTPLDGHGSILQVNLDVYGGDPLLEIAAEAEPEYPFTYSTGLNTYRDSDASTFAGMEFNDHAFSPVANCLCSECNAYREMPIALILGHAGGLAYNTGYSCGSCHNGKEAGLLKRPKHRLFRGGVLRVAGLLMA